MNYHALAFAALMLALLWAALYAPAWLEARRLRLARAAYAQKYMAALAAGGGVRPTFKECVAMGWEHGLAPYEEGGPDFPVKDKEG